MPVNLEISSITGVSPYNLYVCDTGFTFCVYISQITSGDLPYNITIPYVLESVPNLALKIVDDDGCNIINYFST